MSSRKNSLVFQCITNGNMAGNLTSAVTNIRRLDNIAYAFIFTGTPTGTFQIQVSVDYNQDYLGNVLNAGTWTTVTLPSSPVASGSAGNIIVEDLPEGCPWMRATYTASSGTGTLQAYISGKMI